MIPAQPRRHHRRNFAAAWAKPKPPTRASLTQAVYVEVTMQGKEF